MPSRFALLAVAPLLLCGACARRSQDAAARGRITVNYWEKWTGAEAAAMQTLVDEFNRSQDRIFVHFLSISDIDRKVMLATAGGNPPDLAGLYSQDIPTYAENNALIPLDGYARAAGLTADKYLPAIWENCHYRGFLWALPTTPSALALYWNKKMFRAAGLDPDRPPRSLAELEAFNDKLTRRDAGGHIVVMGHLPQQPGWWEEEWGYWFGARLWDGRDRITALDPGNVAALNWVRGYSERFGVRDILGFTDTQGNFASPANPFFRSRVAMVLQGPWLPNLIRQYAPAGFEWGCAPFPAADPAKYPEVTLVENDIIAIPQGAPHPRAAFAFLAWLSRRENIERLCIAQQKFSPLAEVSPDFYARNPNPAARIFAGLARSPGARRNPAITTWNTYKSDLLNAYNEVAMLRAAPVAALAAVQARQQKALDHMNERWARVSAARLREWTDEVRHEP